MKKLYLLLIPLLGLSLLKAADTTGTTDPNDSTYSDLNSNKAQYHFKVTGGIMKYTYDEPGVMNIQGSMLELGVMNGISYQHLFIKADLSASGIGDNTYTGSAVNLSTGAKTPLSATSVDRAFNMSIGIGGIYTYSIFEAYVTIGVGARALLNNILSDAAYSRKQIYYYIPITVNTKFSLNDKLVLLIEGTYRRVFGGYNISYFSNIGYDSDLTFHQQTGNSFEISIGLGYKLNTGIASMAIVYDQYAIGDSDLQPLFKGGVYKGLFLEPANTTSTLGVRLGYEF
ncbi:hypothetical protein BKH43_07825 [Helicobacter sp. 13S00401-1]|uniref:hypothetical protein n=1 Tax=Helicobacter sp. 13S00401-1 TaxID=1905758 RepID=UPI000BA7165A|nr:hypothetical protein [Helicobacter sp. 13S00401-1]PAF48616.1 hypothetical protein BKH43_07825 [Helicobacter sp. 13S00401-1]